MGNYLVANIILAVLSSVCATGSGEWLTSETSEQGHQYTCVGQNFNGAYPKNAIETQFYICPQYLLQKVAEEESHF